MLEDDYGIIEIITNIQTFGERVLPRSDKTEINIYYAGRNSAAESCFLFDGCS